MTGAARPGHGVPMQDDTEDTGIFGDTHWDPSNPDAGGDAAARELVELANTKMPFGKYAGRYLIDLPESYVLWFKQQGWPEGKLGERLRSLEEIKVNGLESLLREFIR